jgi:hypothetical protein
MLVRRLRRRLGWALDWRFAAVNERVEAVARRLDGVAAGLERLEHATAALTADLRDLSDANVAAHRFMLQEHAANRRRLQELRTEEAYAAAFEDPEPLVSVIIPTHTRTDLLLERSLPSVLAQSYERLEVVVAGDAVPDDVGKTVEALGDDRVRFTNLTLRIPDPDPTAQWLIGSVAPRNAGYELARGSWFVDFDDDDALRPRAIERGLAYAREQRVEVSYGGFEQHRPDGEVETVAVFPPTWTKFGLQGALIHEGLRFFQRTPAAAIFGMPSDWFRTEAMLRAGVRFGMHDEIAWDYYPSGLWDTET